MSRHVFSSKNLFSLSRIEIKAKYSINFERASSFPRKLIKPRLYLNSTTMRQISSSKLAVQEFSVPMPWGHIKAQIFGNISSKATPILCLHGYLDNSNSFMPLAPFLCQNNEYYMISVDLPGHGLSSALPAGIPYTPKLFLNSVRRVVKHFDLKSFIFLCHSYGVGISYMV